MPLHDPISYDHVAELISDTEPSQQPIALHDAWREYASRAVRPYAWKTFALYARRRLMQTGDWPPEGGKEKLTPWQDGARASPRVLVLGAYAALRVRGGALSKSSMGRMTTARLSASILMQTQSRTRSSSTVTVSF